MSRVFLRLKRVGMARLKMAPYAYPEGLSESRLPTLQAPKMPSRLEMLRSDYQARTLRAKEEKMVTLLQQQQERISHRVTGSSLYTAHPSQHKSFHDVHQQPYAGPWAPEERAWASNWTVTKRSAGIDRAHPLQPVYHQKANAHVQGSHHPPSANVNRYRPSLPVQEQVRSKSGPARTESWQQLQKREFNLENEIRKKEALIREKLRKTEEELRRIQREREEAEMEDRRVRAMEDARRPRATENRVPRSHHHSGYSEEREGEGRYQRAGDRLNQDIDTRRQMREPTPERRTKDVRQTANVTPPRTNASPQTVHTSRSSIAGDEEEDDGGDLVPCQLCGRSFMAQRLEKHMQVCQKTLNSKRKVFDSSKARAKGTDLEQYQRNKGRARDPPTPTQVKGSSWRQKHESFIRSIRQARLVQDVVSRGGKASDLPPPPPEENPDYVTCPHCSRRFAPRPAQRHIPMCAEIKSKPRPPPARRR
ncbi:zinc finger C2HC domain-containing protein 1C [Mantella aurantiaca]